ncbi:MAG TPA: purine-nucleoside phosphorylase, partial [Actinomycetales bacterium]|nr:purine-nucleoside phosphorylase [Actinomycetales bacterium]
MAPLLSPTADAAAAAARITDASGRDGHDVALVLGSGWSAVVE